MMKSIRFILPLAVLYIAAAGLVACAPNRPTPQTEAQALYSYQAEFVGLQKIFLEYVNRPICTQAILVDCKQLQVADGLVKTNNEIQAQFLNANQALALNKPFNKEALGQAIKTLAFSLQRGKI